MPEIQGARQENTQVSGVKKGWRKLEREQVTVARCRLERLMRRLGLQGVRRGKNVKTIMSRRSMTVSQSAISRPVTATATTTP